MRSTAPDITAIERHADGVELSLHIRPELAWFEGHFPEVSLLPGVVQTTWAVELGRQHFPQEFAAAPNFARMSNMKFMRFIMPDTRITLRLSYLAAKQELQFEYREHDRVCSSGRIGFCA